MGRGKRAAIVKRERTVLREVALDAIRFNAGFGSTGWTVAHFRLLVGYLKGELWSPEDVRDRVPQVYQATRWSDALSAKVDLVNAGLRGKVSVGWLARHRSWAEVRKTAATTKQAGTHKASKVPKGVKVPKGA